MLHRVFMIWFYRLLILPFFLVMCPYYLGRMIRRGGYAKDFLHRLGRVPVLPPRRYGVSRIWIQAVSVGETEAVAPLLRALKKRDDVEVILTTTTSTAYKIIREKYADLVVAFACFPIDFLPFSRRAWKNFDPTLAILMEGELWPEHLTQARARDVPVLLVNARLSDKSFRRYQKIVPVAHWIFRHVDFVCAGTQNDFSRFVALGVPAEKIALAGNMKFDVASEGTFTEAEKNALFEQIFNPEPRDANMPANDGGATESRISEFPVLLGSSTWQGEESVLLEAFAKARKNVPALKLLLVPRHAERRAEIAEIMKKTAWKWYFRSQTAPENVPANAAICVADTTGELRKLTQLATLAFVGKSLPPNKGGQTPIECAALGVPMVYGTEMTNFRDICRSLEDAGAAIKVRSAEAAVAQLCALLQDAGTRERMSRAGKVWHAGNQGATARVLEKVVSYLS